MSILRDKSDEGLVKVLRDNPFYEDVLDFILIDSSTSSQNS